MSNEPTELDPTQQPTTAVEIDLSANDVLVLEIPHVLSHDTMERMRKEVLQLLSRPGPQVLLLTDNITCKVLHRQDVGGAA